MKISKIVVCTGAGILAADFLANWFNRFNPDQTLGFIFLGCILVGGGSLLHFMID